ncbi:MAG TPA: bifunctional phosphoribosylaminoimidazolecarboxamide formyltransferase/IMP cyclohydrolase [Anaerolineales bacterium]|nr:bifunctional phosphoribosylaminoimidazolecarboxamide formyltransferase/IMP cyclohydrolase [Anaerolineales bacterium]
MPKAILSVYDKTGLLEFAKGLTDLGWTIIASGGTARLLHENDILAQEVADFTGSPEILGGRVKTLHPSIHGGILARESQADQHELHSLGWETIDLVVVNLYPFESTISKPNVLLEEAIENIDIGGVALIRAAAKNFSRVTLVCDPNDYPAVLFEIKQGAVSQEMRQKLALKGFATTSHYDSAILGYLTELSDSEGDMAPFNLTLYPISNLRYGENPHQAATLYAYQADSGPLGGKLLQGKPLSYNNLLDLDAAWRAAISYQSPTVSIVKHLSPCGIASADDLEQAFQYALASDPISAFGGVIATNLVFDEKIALALGDLFVECIIAPGFSAQAQEILSRRRNLRLVSMPDTKIQTLYELRSVNQGLLRQSIDQGDPENTEWQVVSQRQPSLHEWQSLRFAWKACQHVKSNAIVLVQGEATVGIGGGQPNRVDCVRNAVRHAGDKTRGAVMASDAFFPFPDSVEEAAKAGVTAIVSPGGSVRDAESIATADAHGIAMVFSGVRHFRH